MQFYSFRILHLQLVLSVYIVGSVHFATSGKTLLGYFAVWTVSSFVHVWCWACYTSSTVNLVKSEVSIPAMRVVVSLALSIAALTLLVGWHFRWEHFLCTFVPLPCGYSQQDSPHQFFLGHSGHWLNHCSWDPYLEKELVFSTYFEFHCGPIVMKCHTMNILWKSYPCHLYWRYDTFSSVSLYLILYCFWSVTSGLLRLFPLICAMGHVTPFVVDASLVVNQWQHWAWTVFLHPPINVKHKAEQATRTVCLFWGVIDQESNPAFQFWCHVLNKLYHSCGV